MDYIWSFRDAIFYGVCSCSSAGGVDTEPVAKTKRSSAHCDLYSVQTHDKWAHLPVFNTMAQTQQYPADQKSTDFFNFLERMQSQRMDDQRSCLVGLRASLSSSKSSGCSTFCTKTSIDIEMTSDRTKESSRISISFRGLKLPN
ncbi:hypothetical protein M3Y95_01170900 [Aphelenchoides besseyi]|nr:hypothetical protein M3Y95_01170900 [Aphelenchoides besseyi]